MYVNSIQIKSLEMCFAPIGDYSVINKKPHLITPQPRNLFGHCYMPANVRKEFLYGSHVIDYSTKKKMPKTSRESVDTFVPMPPLTQNIHTPRPLRLSPAEIRRRAYQKQNTKLDLRQFKREIRELNLKPKYEKDNTKNNHTNEFD